MSYLGRPSAGDSPFAIGQKAFFDTSSPSAPAQRNPTPRQGGTMQTPQPYGGGDVSGEARRRYEERYKKKKEEEAAAAAAKAGGGGQAPGQGHGGMPPPAQQRPPPAQQQSFGPGSSSHGGPPPMQHQQSFGPGPLPPGAYPHSPNPQQPHPQAPPTWSGYSAASPAQQFSQSPHSAHGSLQPQHQPQRSSFDSGRPNFQAQNSHGPPPSGRSQSPYDRQQAVHSPPIQQGQQRWSQQSGGGQHPAPQQAQGGPQWSQKAAPPPPQDFRGRPESAQSHNQQSQGGQMDQRQSSQGLSQVGNGVGDQGDEELRRMFEQFDSSRSGQLNSYDLQRLLAKDSLMEDPREDAVKMLMNIFDTDRSGSINFMEFEGLYRYIQDWHGIFQRFDRDASGLIDRKELHQALLGFGFSLPSEMVRKLEKRFAPPPKLLPDGRVVQRKGISFDRFLMACVTVKHYTEGFRRLDPNNTGSITVDYNSFMEMVLDAP